MKIYPPPLAKLRIAAINLPEQTLRVPDFVAEVSIMVEKPPSAPISRLAVTQN
ncbi:MAG TPA: hypothetical protein PLD25_28100 [Chloroflexota bacterium]|nr:hypothetical protein [Chloroflexota bacterium]